MHFPFDHSSQFKCICTNNTSEVGKTLATQALELVQREGRALEEGILPFPASEHSFTLSLLCPAQHHFTPRHCFFANPHPVSFTHKHPALQRDAVSWIHLPHVWLMCAKCHCTAAVLLPLGAMAGNPQSSQAAGKCWKPGKQTKTPQLTSFMYR